MLDETTTDIDDVPSDLKTVAYFVQAAGMIGGVQDPLNSTRSRGRPPKGLVDWSDVRWTVLRRSRR